MPHSHAPREKLVKCLRMPPRLPAQTSGQHRPSKEARSGRARASQDEGRASAPASEATPEGVRKLLSVQPGCQLAQALTPNI